MKSFSEASHISLDGSQGLDVRIVGLESWQKPLLVVLLFILYMSYGALGRDIFYNSNEVGGDPIGAVLPFVRVLGCATIVLAVVHTEGLGWAFSRIPVQFGPFIGLAFASALWSADPKEAFRGSVTLAAMWVAFPMVIHRLGLLQIVRASLLLISIIVIVSTFLAVFVPSIGTHGQEINHGAHAGRWKGIFSHKNGLGPWAAYGAVFLFSHSWLCRGPRLYWWLARICAVACLIYSRSVTALVCAAFLVGCLVFFHVLRRFRLSVVITTFALTLPAMFVFLYLVGDAIFEYIGRDSTLSGRTEIWVQAAEAFWQNPWFGNGYSSLGGPDFLGRLELTFSEAIPGPESGYYTLILELGIVGAMFYAVPFIMAIRNGFEWLKYVDLEDRTSIEFMLMILLSTLVYAYTESSSMICTGFDGLLAFAGFFALLTTPRSPDSRMRGEFRMAKYYVPPSALKASAAAVSVDDVTCR